MEAYKKTGLYNEVKLAHGEEYANTHLPSKYHSQGVAPFCTLKDFACDLANNNKYPIGPSKNGMGKECLTVIFILIFIFLGRKTNRC